MWITALTNAQPLQVVLVHQQKIDVGIVCQKTDTHWEPLFGVRESGKFQLPSCFELSEDACDALDKFIEIQGL